MKQETHLKTLLIKAGLHPAEAELYLFIRANPGVSVSRACAQLSQSKSTLYRAYEELKKLGLVGPVNTGEWRTSLIVRSLKPLIQKLQNDTRKDQRLLAALRGYETHSKLNSYSRMPGVEVLDEEETYQRYIDLSCMDWDSILAYGNWEGLNNGTRNLIPVEKEFIENRLRKGGKAYVVVTSTGPFTSEIVDFSALDLTEQRKTKQVQEYLRPFWMNVFEGNDYVHLWYQDEKNELFSTFIESKPLAEFYKDQVYARI